MTAGSSTNQFSGFGYDPSGDMIGDGNCTYTFDAENHITRATGMSLSAASLNFGNVKVGRISGPKNVILNNVGATTLSITSIVIAGTDKGDFSVGNT